MKRNVAIISQALTDECRSMLTGLGRHEPASREWTTHLDSKLRAIADPAWFFAQPWNGVIYNHPNRALLKQCFERGLPCVDIDDTSQVVPGIPKIIRDNHAVGRLAAEHLATLNFRTFAFIGYDNCTSCHDRSQGFQSELSRRNQRTLIYSLPKTPRDLTYESDTESSSDQREFEIINIWLSGLPTGTAVLACDDQLASLLLKACLSLGIHCPNEIAILGVGNEEILCDLSKPALSSIDLNGKTRGRVVAQTLQSLMDRTSHTESTIVAIPPFKVVTRNSTDGVAVPDEMLADILNVIRERVSHGLRVEDLVKQSRTSRRLLERRFQKHLGISPNIAIRDALVSKIKGLLASTDKPLSEIAYETGFMHPEYMSVVFKKTTGMTPGSYRQIHSPND